MRMLQTVQYVPILAALSLRLVALPLEMRDRPDIFKILSRPNSLLVRAEPPSVWWSRCRVGAGTSKSDHNSQMNKDDTIAELEYKLHESGEMEDALRRQGLHIISYWCFFLGARRLRAIFVFFLRSRLWKLIFICVVVSFIQ